MTEQRENSLTERFQARLTQEATDRRIADLHANVATRRTRPEVECLYASRDFVVTGDEDPRVVATIAAMEVRRSQVGHLEVVANGTRVERHQSETVFQA
jgi:hypothetical protein